MSQFPLQQAYQELKSQCVFWDIKISGTHTIIRNNTATVLDQNVSKKDALKQLRAMIRKAKEENFNRTQGKLL